MTSLLLRNFIFTVLNPGLVTGFVPWYLLRNERNVFERPLDLYLLTGMLVMSAGIIILMWCILKFAFEGNGTLSPMDPTKRLVVRGLYRFSRNPMYAVVVIILVGEAILTGSSTLWIYLTVIFIIFNLFILFHEEPRLRKYFGEEYNQYCRTVRRWV